ncbi:RpoE-regulated lipoprotein [Erwinia mallotivora]|uniref:RpoE-regulated lipoprotein n=1 Tax=Erwinia mallotivora TaxID=69222 RepID=A0A014NM01_9GAMM|nr:RpoE-regulated lipoprotein [Erwinia mallotivora]EXU74805.1 RpoE-regulated lipoprotein [Erwinia mallotivora]
MKTVRPLLIAAALMIAGCASSGDARGADSGASWWNPLSWSWSAAAPWNWFGSSLQVSEQGIGTLNAATPMNEEAIGAALKNNYQIRKGMRGENGGVVTFFQGVEDKKVRIVVNGTTTDSQIEVSDPAITTSDGKKMGTPFSELYSKAFGACLKVSGSEGVECKAPGSQHISYVFSGEWHGPEGLLPADETLKKWTISKIIWRK